MRTGPLPLDLLLGQCRRAGWYGLGHGEILLLRAFGDLLPPVSATATTTAFQLSCAAGLSERWTRELLHRFEDMGLIEWRRGGVRAGRPQPGLVRVVRKRLAAIVRAMRERHRAKVRLHDLNTADRVFGLGTRRPPARRRSSDPDPIDLGAFLSALHERPPPTPVPPDRGADDLDETVDPRSTTEKIAEVRRRHGWHRSDVRFIADP